MIADLGLAIGVEGFLKDTNDDERYAFNTDGSADSGAGAAIEFVGEWFDDDRDLVVRHLILVVEEAARNNHEIAYDFVLRGDAKQHGRLADHTTNGRGY